MCRPLDRGGVFVAGLGVGQGLSAVYRTGLQQVELLSGGPDSSTREHAITDAALCENTAKLNAEIRYAFLEDMDMLANLSAGMVAARLEGKETQSEVWSELWTNLRQIPGLYGKKADAAALQQWLETAFPEQYRDRSLAVMMKDKY